MQTTEKVCAVLSKAHVKAEQTLSKFEKIRKERTLTPNESKLYLNAWYKLDNLSASKLYISLFGEDVPADIQVQVATVWGNTVKPTFATFASYLPLGKDENGNPAPKKYLSLWDGLGALARNNKAAQQAAKALKQGALIAAKAEREAAMIEERKAKADAKAKAKAEKDAAKAATAK